MTYKIAITSGKGGTGKTTVSTGLFYVLTKHLKYSAQLIDCDVEEPDCHIFIKGNMDKKLPVNISIPVIHDAKCTYCGICKEACAFNAIVIIPSSNFIEVVEDMCHACGACSYLCPEEGAVTEKTKEIGQVTYYNYNNDNDSFIEGRMHVGNALQTRVIRDTIRHTGQQDIILYDSPPGTSCPVVATVSKSDYVVLVTEPSPFGLYDLKLMTETVKILGKKHGVIINKSGLDYKPLYDYLKEENMTLLGEIPFKKEYAKEYSKGNILPESDNDLANNYKNIINRILDGKTL